MTILHYVYEHEFINKFVRINEEEDGEEKDTKYKKYHNHINVLNMQAKAQDKAIFKMQALHMNIHTV